MALQRDSRIFIIGCGVSGIGAAQKLLKHGFRNVHIIEATGRIGGRIRTGRLGKTENNNGDITAVDNMSSSFNRNTIILIFRSPSLHVYPPAPVLLPVFVNRPTWISIRF